LVVVKARETAISLDIAMQRNADPRPAGAFDAKMEL